MVFNSFTFFIFFAIVIAARFSPLSWASKKRFLTVASYLFYAAWNPPFVALLWISTIVDWLLARRMMRTAQLSKKRVLLLLSLLVNLGILSAFKYSQFLIDTFVAAAAAFGIEYAPIDLGIVLPVGISFYTFQTLSWTFDVYRGNVDARRVSLTDFALFVAFFPQLVAGPIVRAVDFLPQLEREPRPTGSQIGWGLSLLTIGLFEKTVLADAFMSPVSDLAFDNGTDLSMLEAWTGALAFSGQIFFDFAGYSTCAIGVAMVLGFGLPDNFRFPYAAAGFSDFWARWHISLSSWLRDYLYISLGGNRLGEPRRYINLMLTMLLGGLWHGAAWTFVFWGFLHGAYLVIERWIVSVRPAWLGGRLGLLLGITLTQIGVLFAWVPFRAPSFEVAYSMIRSMVGLTAAEASHLSTVNVARVLPIAAGLYLAHFLMRNTTLEEAAARLPRWGRVAILAALLFGIVTSSGGNRAFIYFQF